MKRAVDIVVLSDVQLGSNLCKSKELLNYLESVEIGTLILNGDFICFAKLQETPLPKAHIQVIQKVLKIASEMTKVYYLSGDQDAKLKKQLNSPFNQFHFRDNLNLQLKGKSYWIFHGDVLDFSLLGPSFGRNIHQYNYRQLVKYNTIHKKISRLLGFTAFQKNTTKTANYIQQFEDKALRMASYHSCDYIICGHTRQAQMKTKEINGKKVTYLNAGDWQNHLTALEYKWNHWSIFEYESSDYQHLNTNSPSKIDSFNYEVNAFTPASTQIIEDFLRVNTLRIAR
ncbi:MAG: metallophosphoesterase family protein [Saprospiraceae bacterium]|nr:metallophosphoesterase family protein [Saprospiraceae bacterium]